MVSNNTSSENEIEFGEQQCFDTPKEEALYWKQVAVDYMQRYVPNLEINCLEPKVKRQGGYSFSTYGKFSEKLTFLTL